MTRRPPRSPLFPYTPLFRSDFKLTLLRTLKIAAHETGHMFSVRHCTKYECVMNGSNHLGETDRSEEHTSELQSRQYLVCRLLLEKKKIRRRTSSHHINLITA